MPLPVCTSTDF